VRTAPIKTTSEQYGVSEQTLRRYIAQGKITGYRLGPRMIRVDLDEVEALLKPISTEAINREAEADPPLTVEQRARIAVLLTTPQQVGGGDAAA
jgi:excisionase family DNA binding protein